MVRVNPFTGELMVDADVVGAVTSVFGRTGAVVAATDDYTWAQIDKSVSDLADIVTKSHTVLSDIGTNTHAQIDTHIADGTVHFLESAIDHTAIQNIGTYTHAQLDSHVDDSTIHFLEGAIDHVNILNIGTNSHTAIDTHIGDTTIHFTEASIDHGVLLGLTDDTHSQYALLAGRSGGQTLIGGADASDNLTLQSTSDATKGSVIFGAAGTTAYDEVNARFGVGTGTPLYQFHVSDGGSAVSGMTETPIAMFQNNSDGSDDAYIAIVCSDVTASSGIYLGDTSNGDEAYIWNASATGQLKIHAATILNLNTNDRTVLWADNNGLGVNNLSPAHPLDVTGNIRLSGQLISTLAIGTKPLDVTSTTLCTNLNADLLDGSEGAAFLLLAGRAGAGNDFTMSTDDDANIIGSNGASKDLYIHANDNDTAGLIRLQDTLYLREDFPTPATLATERAIYFAPSYTNSNTATSTFIELAPTISATGITILSCLRASGTTTVSGSGSTSFIVFQNSWTNQSATAGVDPSGFISFLDGARLKASGAVDVGTCDYIVSYRSAPSVQAVSGGTILVPDIISFDSQCPGATGAAGAGTKNVTNRYGLKVSDATNLSALTNQYGIYIDDLTAGGTINASLVSAGAAVQMRHAGPGVFGANAAPTNASTGLEVQSTTKAFLLPRMSAAERGALTAVNGMVVYDTTNNAVYAYENGSWVDI